MKTQAFKYRVVGAVFIVSLAVIIIPALLDPAPSISSEMTEVVSPHPLAFSKPSAAPLEPNEYAFSELVNTLKAEELAANPAPAAVAKPAVEADVSEASQASVAAVPEAETVATNKQADIKVAAPTAKTASTAPAKDQAATPPVVAQSLPPGYTPPTAVAPVAVSQGATTATSGQATSWSVQMGAFTSEENANALVARLQAAGYSAYVYSRNSSDLFRVLVGVDREKEKADQRLQELNTKLQLSGVVIQF